MYVADLVSVINWIMSLNTKCLFHTIPYYIPYMAKNKNQSLKLSHHVNGIVNLMTQFNTC